MPWYYSIYESIIVYSHIRNTIGHICKRDMQETVYYILLHTTYFTVYYILQIMLTITAVILIVIPFIRSCSLACSLLPFSPSFVPSLRAPAPSDVCARRPRNQLEGRLARPVPSFSLRWVDFCLYAKVSGTRSAAHLSQGPKPWPLACIPVSQHRQYPSHVLPSTLSPYPTHMHTYPLLRVMERCVCV